MDSPATTKHIVFIHGMFMNPASWDQWMRHFSARGYTCHAPAYPGHEGAPADLRAHIDPRLTTLSFHEVVEDLRSVIESLPSRPILIGHSMGGLVVQKLISLDVGAMGVCIDSAPPAGLFSFEWSFLRANLPVINPLKGDRPLLPSVEWFHYAFCNTMTMAQTRDEYEQFVVPESRTLPRSSTKSRERIDFTAPHRPLLFVAGEQDHIIPASLNTKNAHLYRDSASRVDLQVFAGRTHYICGQPGWDEVADCVARWIESAEG